MSSKGRERNGPAYTRFRATKRKNRMMSSTPGSAKGTNCQKTAMEILACSSKADRLIKPEQLRNIYRAWNAMKGNTQSSIY